MGMNIALTGMKIVICEFLKKAITESFTMGGFLTKVLIPKLLDFKHKSKVDLRGNVNSQDLKTTSHTVNVRVSENVSVHWNSNDLQNTIHRFNLGLGNIPPALQCLIYATSILIGFLSLYVLTWVNPSIYFIGMIVAICATVFVYCSFNYTTTDNSNNMKTIYEKDFRGSKSLKSVLYESPNTDKCTLCRQNLEDLEKLSEMTELTAMEVADRDRMEPLIRLHWTKLKYQTRQLQQRLMENISEMECLVTMHRAELEEKIEAMNSMFINYEEQLASKEETVDSNEEFDNMVPLC